MNRFSTARSSFLNLPLAACIAWSASGLIHAQSPAPIHDSTPSARLSAVAGPALVQPVQKSVATAYALSILGTIAPIMAATQISKASQEGNSKLPTALVLGGFLVGPSLGQFYAGSHAKGTLALGVRAGGGFMTMAGVALAFRGMYCAESEGGDCEQYESLAVPFMMVGTITYLAGAIYSLYDAERAVTQFNRRQNEAVFGWAPTFEPGQEGSLKSGAMAWMRF